VTKQQIYNIIVSLTAEIKTTGVGLKIYEAAKVSGQKVKEVSETFMTEHPELYQKMCSFANEYNKLIEESKIANDAAIFGPEKDEENGIFLFDLNEINATSYFVLMFLTEIDDTYLYTEEFYEYEAVRERTVISEYLDIIEEESGSSDLALFLGTGFFNKEELEYWNDFGFEYSDFYELLADVFAGKLKEYLA